MNSAALKPSLLCFEAKRWVGIREEGNNSGQIVQMFQRAVDNQANGESWCMAFVQYCVKMVDATFKELFPGTSESSSLFSSEACLTVWNHSAHLQTQSPSAGALCIWQRFSGNEATWSGHTGIVSAVHGNGTISIIEGNSCDPKQGYGVWVNHYSLSRLNQGSLALKGFLDVWK